VVADIVPGQGDARGIFQDDGREGFAKAYQAADPLDGANIFPGKQLVDEAMEIGSNGFGPLQMHVFFRFQADRPMWWAMIGQAGCHGFPVTRSMPAEHGVA
jgi:hypothetical protein